MKNKKHFAIFVSLILTAIFGIMPLHAVDQYVIVIYRQLDTAFADKNDKELNKVLETNAEDENYYLIENYTMKKIRRLVVDEEYQFAMQANLIVIDNNLDNMDAVELYSTIANALEKQKEQERIQAEKDAAAYAKYVAEKQKHKTEAVKQFNTSTTADGKEVFVASKDEKYTATNWSFKFNLADLMFINVPQHNNYSSVRYGIGGDFKYDYTFDKVTVGFDAGLNFIMLPLSGQDNTMLPDIYVQPKIGFGNFGRYAMIRLGFVGLWNMHMKDNESCLRDSFLTPSFGISFNHVELGPGVLSGGVDYYLSSLKAVYDDMVVALGGDLNYSVPIAKMEKLAVNFNIGLRETIFVMDNGIENRASVVLAIGAENVAK